MQVEMGHPKVQAVLQEVNSASSLYCRLILVVGSSHTGKSHLLFSVADELNIPCVNIGIELSSRLLDVSPKQKALQLPNLLAEQLPPESSIAVLDNIEILFDTSLHNNPLKLLQKLSRNTTIVTAWPGEMKEGTLIYATSDHPEYREYPSPEAIIFDLNTHTAAPNL